MESTGLRDDAFTNVPGGDSVQGEPEGTRPIDISRKITACVACRKQKVCVQVHGIRPRTNEVAHVVDNNDPKHQIKCHMPQGQAPCVRCRKRGLSCTVNRSLQMLIQDHTTWKSAMMTRMQNFETAMAKVGERLSMPELKSLADSPDASQLSPDSSHGIEPPQQNFQPQQPYEIVMDLDCGPASIPASCVAEGQNQASPGDLRSASPPDFISRGVISLPQAELLFNMYHQRLDHFLYRILGHHDSLMSVRQSSPLLTAAICAVAALHSDEAGHLFGPCYTVFQNTVASQLFSRQNNLDDVRGVCIGAFWLSQLSWTLVSTAVRIATEIQLHRGIYQALQGDKDGYYQTRVYYLVYVCDHHFSVTYGRPPMTRECHSISAASRFLQTENATEDDARLVSQVLIWAVNTNIFDSFGVDVNTPLAAQELSQLRRHSIGLDIWYADWSERFRPNQNIGNYPRKGVGLHFNFAKLYLCSHAFRGAPSNGNAPGDFPQELEDIANTAVLSATSILRVIVSDGEFQAYLNGLPLYFDTMIAFAVVFLLKVATKYSQIVRIDATKMLDLVEQTATILRRITAPMHDQHLLVYIVDGIEKLLKKSQEAAHMSLSPSMNVQQVQQTDSLINNFQWIDNMGDFDILSTQNNVSGLGPWSFDFDLQGPHMA